MFLPSVTEKNALKTGNTLQAVSGYASPHIPVTIDLPTYYEPITEDFKTDPSPPRPKFRIVDPKPWNYDVNIKINPGSNASKTLMENLKTWSSQFWP